MKSSILRPLCALTLLALLLGGCTARDGVSFSPAHGEVLLASGAFDPSLEPVDLETAALLYGLEPDQLVDGVCYLAANTSVSADELAILVCKDEQAAQTAQTALEQRVDSQFTVSQSYCPAAIPHLEGAIIQRTGNTVLLAVGEPTGVLDAIQSLQ